LWFFFFIGTFFSYYLLQTPDSFDRLVFFTDRAAAAHFPAINLKPAVVVVLYTMSAALIRKVNCLIQLKKESPRVKYRSRCIECMKD